MLVCDEDGLIPPGRFDLRLDHRDLTLSDEEVAGLLPDRSDPAELHMALHATGAVPELLAAWQPEWPPVAGGELARRSARWAERIVDRVLADPLLVVQLWAVRAPALTVAAIAGELLGAPVSAADVERARAQSFLTVTSQHDPCLPDAVSLTLRARAQRDVPDLVADLRRAIVTATASRGIGPWSRCGC